jgi:peroxiredoxin Q/BCP
MEASGKELAVGDRAPEFSLHDHRGHPVTLKSLKGRQVVLYFYPKDDTPGCTKEACGFRDSMATIQKTGAVVLGVSPDDGASHQKFIAKYGLPFSLLSDEDSRTAKAYGVYKLKNMYGKKYWGVERTTFVIDPTGRLKAIFKKVKVDGHAEEVLEVLQDAA